MALKRQFEMIAIFQILSLIFLSFGVNGDDGSFDVEETTSRRGLTDTGAVTFDVSKYGARGDGRSDSTQGVMKAWTEVCKATTAARLLIPNGKFLTGELMFQGPCAPKPITIEVQGTLMAKPDCKTFVKDTWIYVIGVNHVTMTGGGTLHAQGEGVWKTRALGEKGTPLPDSVVFANSNNSAIRNLKLVNSKGFQMKVFDLVNFTADNMNICAPGNSPNTDGIHIGRVKKVAIINSVIGVGDDCISIGDGSYDITVRNVTCGPGHGISIGSLGRYKDEKDVRGVHVSNCTLWNTTNGARIKTFRESPALQATNITFENIIMKDVYNPIIVDQNYASLYKKGASNVKISDVKFKNIRGSSTANIAVQLSCSSTVPCQNIELTDIDFTYTGNPYNTTLVSACCNAHAKFSGKQKPTACSM